MLLCILHKFLIGRNLSAYPLQICTSHRNTVRQRFLPAVGNNMDITGEYLSCLPRPGMYFYRKHILLSIKNRMKNGLSLSPFSHIQFQLIR